MKGRVCVPGGNVWYRMEGAYAQGVPLVVLHGGPGMTHDYLEPLLALADERPVILYDQLGCGGSVREGDPDAWTVDDLLDELNRVREALSIRRAHVLGHGFGAALAVEHAVAAAQGLAWPVSSLTLASPFLSAAVWMRDQSELVDTLEMSDRIAFATCEAGGDPDDPVCVHALAEFRRRYFCRVSPWPDCLARSMERECPGVRRRFWGRWEFAPTGCLFDYDCREKLAQVRVPALFTCGEYDQAAPPSVRGYAALCAHGAAVVFEGASHLPHLEATDAFLEEIRDFLRRASRAAQSYARRQAWAC